MRGLLLIDGAIDFRKTIKVVIVYYVIRSGEFNATKIVQIGCELQKL